MSKGKIAIIGIGEVPTGNLSAANTLGYYL